MRTQTTNKIVFGEELSKTEVKPQAKPEEKKTPVKQIETADSSRPLGVWSEEGLAKVNIFQKNISALTNIKKNKANQAQRTDLTASIMALFADNMRVVESSDLQQQITSHSLRKYLGTLSSSTDRQNVLVEWYKPAEITDFVKQSDKSYKAQIHIFQEFRQTNLNNELLYGDRVEKMVDLWAKLVKENGTWVWKLSLGNISVVKGSTQSIPK